MLLGCPVSTDSASWDRIRAVVNGRLINGYSQRDLVLSFLYRIEGFRLFVAGVSPVNSRFVENIDLSNLVHYHGDYALKMKQILEHLRIDSV